MSRQAGRRGGADVTATPAAGDAVSPADSTVIELQAELAFQGEALRALNDAMAGQQQDLLLLQRQVELLSEQLRGLREAQTRSDGDPPADEKPPHY